MHRLSRDNDPSCLPLPSLSLFLSSLFTRSSSIAFSKNLLARASRAVQIIVQTHPSSGIALNRKGRVELLDLSQQRRTILSLLLFIRVRVDDRLSSAISGDSQLRDALSRLKFLFAFSSKERKSVSWLCFSTRRGRHSFLSSLCPPRLARVSGIIPKGIRLIGYEIRAHLEKRCCSRSRSRITSFPANFIRKLCLRFFPFLLTSLVDSNQEEERGGKKGEWRGVEGEKEEEEGGEAEEKLPLPGMELERIVLDDRIV